MHIQAPVRARYWLWWPLGPERGSLLLLGATALELEIIGQGRGIWRHAGTGQRLALVLAAEA